MPTIPDAGVADDNVEPTSGFAHIPGQPADLGEIGQVGEYGVRLRPAAGVPDVLGGSVELAAVSAVQDQGGAVGGQLVGQGAAQAVGGASDEDRSWVSQIRSQSVVNVPNKSTT